MKTSVPNSSRSMPSSGLGSSVVSNGMNPAAAVYSNGSVASSISNNHNQEGIAIGGCGGFQAFPNQIIFKDFEAPGNYKETISFRNNDNVSRRISIFAPKSRFFKVEPVKKNTSNTLVAPGLDVTFNVFFSPDEKIDYSCDLIVRTEQDEFAVPIIAIGLRALLDLPESVTFDDAPVKHTSSKVIYVRNIGKSRSKGFSLEADLPFDVSPREVPELNVGEGVQISISFNPEKTQQYTGKLKLGFDTINYKTVLLQGVGKSANVKLDTNVMALPNTYITCKTQRTMRIINNSNIRVNFNWKLFALSEDESSYKIKSIAQLGTQYDETTREYRLKKREIENDDMSFRDEAFSIYPIKGEIWPNQELEISVDFHPTKEIDFEKIAFCEVTGRETRLPLKLQGRGRGPNVSFSYTEINIGEIFINSVHEYEVRLDNKGQIGASFDLIKPSSLFGPKFQFVPQSGYVAATESQIIKIFFNSDIIGSFEEDIYFRIEGRHEDLRLHFSGQIIGPTFNFDCNEINFGTVSYGFLNTKYIQIINTCEIPMKYTLRIPEDGTMLKRQFDIIPSDGHILPHTKKQIKIEYLSSKLKDYKANLVVDVEGVGDNLIYLPILATTVSPMITLPKTQIDFGECFIGYEYKNFLDLVNNTTLSSKYEIILPSEEIQKQYECSTESCFGIVNNKSTSQVEFLFKSKVIGEISFPLYVKVVGSEQPPFEVIVVAKSIGPVVQLSESVIDFGKVNVLETVTKTIQLINKSPIVATYSGVFKGKIAGIFSAKSLSGKIEPNNSIDFEVEANLDDVTKFSDELVFSIEYADKLVVKLSASGKGNTIIATESMDVIDFGDQFTSTAFKKIITLENKSRKIQKLSWMAERKKGDTSPQVFKITPEKVMIQAKTSQVFTVEGFCESEGEISEPWQCKIAGGKKDVIIFSPMLKSMISVPLLKFSDTSLSFLYSYVKGVPALVQSKSLEVTNISPLPVSFSAKLQPPFVLAVSDYTIGPNQSKILDVQFNPVYKSDKQTADIKSKMILTYTDHPNKSSVDLIGSVLFPNLVLSSSFIDFGTVVADAEKTHTITMENKGKVTAVFSFIFEVDNDYLTSQLFDILPMNGIIEPGESVDVKFIYNAAKFGTHTTTAFCDVEGGPQYVMNLKGESSSVKFNVDNSDLDFGVVPFHSQQEKEIVISNTGKIAIDFDFDFSIMKRKEIVQVLPSNGRIKPGDKQKVTIKLNPKIPEVINEQFTLMVAMYEPIIISVKALSVHPMVTISMKTKAEEEPGSPIYTNQQDFEKHLDAAKKHASRGTTLMQEAMRRLGSEGKSTSFKNLSLVQSVQKEAERLMLCDYLMVNPMKSVKVKNSLARVSRSTIVKQFEQPDIVLQRMVVDFGATIKGLTKKKSFKLSNVGILPISIQVNKKDLAKYGITMEPSEISNLPGFPDNQSVNVEMAFQSKSEKVEIGDYNAIIPVRVTNGYLIEIEARASVILPEITVSESTLNFGDVNVGYAKVYTIQIFNEKDVNSEWAIESTKKKDNPFTFDIMGGILSPREKKNIQVTFIPTGDKKNSQIFLLKCNYNPQPTKITCNGNGKDLNIKVDYIEQEMGPILPYESTIIPFTINNSSECAVDLYSNEFDEQLRRESEIILACDSFEKGYILAKPREFGGPLNEDILEKYNEITKPPNPENDEKQDNQDVGIGQIDETPKKRHIFVLHTPPMPVRTDLASFISTKLNIPIITIDETLKDYKSAHLDESLSTVSITDLIGLALSERTGQIDCKRGFIIDGLYNSICNDLEMISKIIIDKLQTESINFVNIDGIEAEIRLSGITDLVEKARSAMDGSRYPKLSEEDYESLADEAKRMFELQIKTFRENKIQYDKLYSELTKVEKELEGSSSKLISEIILERKKDDEEYQKKLEEEAKKASKTKKTTTGKIPSKSSRPTTPSSSEVIPPYVSFVEELAIHDNESQYDIYMKLYKRYFFEIISVFKKLHLEEVPVLTNDKNKNKTLPPTKKKDEIENVIITQKYIPEKKSENMDMIMKKIPGLEEFFTQETVIQTPTELAIPDPFILQVIKKPTTLQPIDLSTPFTILSGKDSDATRWTIQPGGKQELFIKFSSKQIGKFETNLSFGIFGRNSQFTIKTSGMCQYPEISTFHKNVFSRRVKTRPDKGLAKKYVINENAYEYGPLLIRPSYDTSDESNLKEYLDVFRFTNNGKFTSEVNVTLEKEDKTFNIVPHQLSIPPDQTSEVKIWALPKTVGKIKNSVICTIKNNPIPYKFDIACTGSKPKIELDKNKIDFGKVLLSSTGYNETIGIKNMAYIPVVWKIKNKAHIKQEFTIEPSEGKLMPGENASITVKFNSAVACELEEKMILTVSDAQEILTPEENVIVLKADAFGLDVNMDCVLDFGTVKVYESSSKTISMTNNGKYDAAFKFVIPDKLKSFFTITPMEGVLQTKAKQKTTVEVVFKTNTEVFYNKNKSIQCQLVDNTTKMALGTTNLEVSVKSMFSKFTITPENGINFGPLSFDKERQRPFEIFNTGIFDIQYTLFDYSKGLPESATEDKSNTNDPKKKGNDTKKNNKTTKKVDPQLQIGQFMIQPTVGTIAPGSKASINITFKGDGTKVFQETLGIDISDRNMEEQPNGIAYYIQGESCVPGIVTNEFESIFEEQQIVSNMDMILNPLHSSFTLDERIFHFGTIPVGKKVTEKIKVINPFKVPCNVECSVKPRDMTGNKDINMFEATPPKLFIPPHEHRYVNISFLPPTMNNYSAIFEATVTDGNDIKTKDLKIEIRGEGSLPQVLIKKPEKVGENSILKFPKTAVGRREELPVLISNEGLLPATVRFDFPNHSSLLFPSRLEEFVLESKESKKFSMIFEPHQAEQIETTLNMVVLDNHFEDTSIKVIAESFEEDVIINNLPLGKENELNFGDCYVKAKNDRTFVLENHAKVPVRFQFETPDGITVSPCVGHIQPKSSKEIIASFFCDEPTEIKGDLLKCSLKKIEFLNEEEIDWDDRHKSIKWVEVDEEEEARKLKELEEKKQREKEQKENEKKGIKKKEEKKPTTTKPVKEEKIEPQEAKPKKLVTKRMEVTDPEPQHNIIGDISEKSVAVFSNADYAKFEINTTEVVFSTTKMFETRVHNVILKNTGKVLLNYSWNSSQYIDGPFELETKQGQIKPGEQNTFTIKYAPQDVDKHEEIFTCYIDNIEPSFTIPSVRVLGISKCPLVHFELSPSDYLSGGRRKASMFQNQEIESLIDKDKTRVIELYSCGIKVKNTKRFYILNPTDVDFKYSWQKIQSDPNAEDNSFSCLTRTGIINSGKKSEIIFEYVPYTIETKESLWMFSIPSRNLNIPFLVVGHAKEPEVFLDSARVNFQTVLVGAKSSQVIHLINREPIPFSFSFDQTEFFEDNQTDRQPVLLLSPKSGTIPADSTIPITLLYTPTAESSFNFQVACRVKKKPSLLTCNVKGEGFLVHESLEVSDESMTRVVPVSFKDNNNVDFERAQINEKKIKKVIITNHGNYNFDYQWFHAKNKLITINPDRGTVFKGGKQICDIIFNPTAQVKLDGYKCICKVTNSNSYVLNLFGSGAQPKINFSFLQYDFGAHFLYHQGMDKSPSTMLKIENCDEKDISFEMLYDNKPHLEVEASATVLKPGESRQIKVYFRPREIKLYKETVMFEINGLYKTSVIFTGEGTASKVELSNPVDKVINLGSIRGGEVITKYVNIVNKSKITANVSLMKETLDQLAKCYITLSPKTAFSIHPRQEAQIGLTFKPESRLSTFNVELNAYIDGRIKLLSNVTGSCQGVEVKLNTSTIAFGPVVQNTVVVSRAIIENTGDIGVNYKWNTKGLYSAFAIKPLQGFIPPNEEALLEITYSPSKIDTTGQSSTIECKLDSVRDPIPMTISGICVEKPKGKETLSFRVAVRQKQNKSVKIDNPTKSDWRLKPVIDNPFWSGLEYLEVPANSTREYEVTYAPLSMTLNSPHKGTLFFPLPDGKAILYELTGESLDPLPAGSIIKDLYAKEHHIETLFVENWLGKAQRFAVILDDLNIKSPNQLTAVNYIDVPPISKREYKFSFLPFKDGQFEGKVRFVNEETKEFIYYNVKFNVLKARSSEEIVMETPVRQKIVKTVTVENPLEKESVLAVKCDSTDIIVASELRIPAKSFAKCEFVYLPLLVSDPKKAKLTIGNDELGIFPFDLLLKPIAKVSERSTHFSVSLGNSQTQTIRFVNFARQVTEYTCKIEDNQPDFALVDKPVVKAPQATSLEGNEISLDVTYEPTMTGATKAKLILTSPIGGEYVFWLFGKCSPPRAQGPIEIIPNGTSQITFKNVFDKKTDFKFVIDDPSNSFSVKPDNASMTVKQKLPLTISYKPSSAAASKVTYGKLTISSKGSQLTWLYYLMGKPNN